MPALPFSNSMSLAPNLMDDNLTRGIDLPPGPDGPLLSGGLPLAVDLDPPLDGPDVVGSFRRSFCSSSFATNLARRCWTGSFPVFGRAVNESDFRTGMYRFSMVG
jgi:hypothetical protein